MEYNETIINVYLKEGKTIQSITAKKQFAFQITQCIYNNVRDFKDAKLEENVEKTFQILYTNFRESNTHDKSTTLLTTILLNSFYDQRIYSKSHNFSNSFSLLRKAIQSPNLEVAHLSVITDTYGQIITLLSLNNSAMIDDEVDQINVLLSTKNDKLVLAAILMLKKIAENMPTLFNTHVVRFLPHITREMHNGRSYVRDAAIECMSVFIRLIAKREYMQKLQLYSHVYQQAIKDLKKDSVEAIQASIGVIEVLLKYSGQFMVQRLRVVAKRIWALKQHSNKTISRTVINSLPVLARYNPTYYRDNFFNDTITFFHNNFLSDRNKDIGFKLLAEIIMAVQNEGSNLKLRELFAIIYDTLQSNNRGPYLRNIYQSISILSKSLKSQLRPFCRDLTHKILKNSLCEEMLDALANLQKYSFPSPVLVNELLWQNIFEILKKKSSNEEIVEQPPQTKHIFNFLSGETFIINNIDVNIPKTPQMSEEPVCVIALALQTVRRFKLFDKKNTLSTIKVNLMPFLENDDCLVRKEAALTCAHLIRKFYQNHNSLSSIDRLTIFQILEKILMVGICDPVKDVRLLVISALMKNFEFFLSQHHIIGKLTIALNDESIEVRRMTIQIIGSLASLNPSFILPSIKKALVQLLFEVKNSNLSSRQAESATLLRYLFISAPEMTRSYAHQIMDTLLPVLNKHDMVTSSILSAIGALSKNASIRMKSYQQQLVPKMIKIFQNKNTLVSRRISLKALREMFESTSDVTRPYQRYPNLLPALISSLKPDNDYVIRREAGKLIGFLGAWNPAKYSEMINDEKDFGSLPPPSVHVPKYCFRENDKDYFYRIAVNALVGILNDPGLSEIHFSAIRSLIRIVQKSSDISKKLLPQIINAVLKILKTISTQPEMDKELTVMLLKSLIYLLPIADEHAEDFTREIFELIKKLWRTKAEEIFVALVVLMQEVSKCLNDSFSLFLSEIITLLLQAITKYSIKREFITLCVLRAFRSFVLDLEDYLFVVIPEILALCEKTIITLAAKKSSLLTLCTICANLDVRPFSSKIIHCQMRVLYNDGAVSNIILNTVLHVLFQLESKQLAMFLVAFEKVMESKKIENQNFYRLISKFNTAKKFNYRDFLNKVADADGKREMLSKTFSDELPEHFGFYQAKLLSMWNTNNMSTREDWVAWLKNFSLKILKENPSPAIRLCYAVALKYQSLAWEIFNTAFVSCWFALTSKSQDNFIFNLEKALSSNRIPHETISVLLNLVEFMEHCQLAIPIKHSLLGKQAQRVQSYAKALHYKELDFYASPKSAIESIISLYNQLQQPKSADGMLEYALKRNIKLNESWYEKLHRWENALEVYERNSLISPGEQKWRLGRLRCLKELGEWQKLHALSKELLREKNSEKLIEEVAPLGITAAWSLGKWESMERFVDVLADSQAEDKSEVTADCTFFQAVISVHKRQFEDANEFIEKTRQRLDYELTSLVGESYNRAYPVVVKLQKLAELEEIIHFEKLQEEETNQVVIETAKHNLKTTWMARLKGCKRNIRVWRQLLDVRSLLLKPRENVDMLLSYSSICRLKGLLSISLNVIGALLGVTGEYKFDEILRIKGFNKTKYTYLKHLWDAGLKDFSLQCLEKLIGTLSSREDFLKAKFLVRFAEWKTAQPNNKYGEAERMPILDALEEATQLDRSSYKAFHKLAMLNYKVAGFEEKRGDFEKCARRQVLAVRNFLSSLALNAHSAKTFSKMQDALRVTSLLFESGGKEELQEELREGFERIGVDIWLEVLPQIIARVKNTQGGEQRLIRDLLLKVSKVHPQAMIYPLTVASKSYEEERRNAAKFILGKMREVRPKLVEQAQLVSNELIRVASLWPEMSILQLTDASECFLKNQYSKMIEILMKLHKRIDICMKSTTGNESYFKRAFGVDFQNASDCITRFRQGKLKSDLDEAWSFYCNIYKSLQKRVDNLSKLGLSDVSPALLAAEDLELRVPGKYSNNTEEIKIQSFSENLIVIKSKRKPRKLCIVGSNGQKYHYILKGNEDLRQDERVMQLFGLVNAIFEQTMEATKSSLSIRRYAVVPVAPDTGLIEWVPNCDTLYELIKEHRVENKKDPRAEADLCARMGANFARLTLPQKAHMFERVLANTSGDDLREVLWARSENAEAWFERRTTFARSLAVMSMVGYVLGLGDRHPNNLMLDRASGKAIHIDFGDCFEVAMERARYPEKIPFRLTRMMVDAMGVSGVEGLFRSTCEEVMLALRTNRDSLLAALEAFVYDPLINWRLIDAKEDEIGGNFDETSSPIKNEIFKTFSSAPKSIHFKYGDKSGDSEALVERSLKVMKRIYAKLSGQDFGQEINEKQQVRRLILEATSLENLCQCYPGWCPFW